MDIVDGTILVRRARPPSGGGQRHGGVVARGHAGGAIALGVDPRPPGTFQNPGLVMYRRAGRTGFHARLFRATLADGSGVRRGTRPFGRANPTPMVRQSHRPDDAVPAGAVFIGDIGSTPCLLN